MALKPEDFDKLRKQASEIDSKLRNHIDFIQASFLTKQLFLDIINDMEKIQGMITETKIDLTKHDEYGRVADPDDPNLP